MCPTHAAVASRLPRAAALAGALLLAAASWVHAQPPNLTIPARTARPGDVVAVRVTVPSGATGVAVRAFDVAWPAYQENATTWRALVGIDLDRRPGTYEVVATQATPAGSDTSPLTVVARRFRTRTLTVAPDYVNPSPELLARITADGAFMAAAYDASIDTPAWTDGFVRPVPGAANSSFGTRSVFNGERRNPHAGTDFLSGTGTPVHAPAGGRIVAARDLFFTGNTVVIDHGLGVFSMLAHLSRIDVHEGDTVDTGMVVDSWGPRAASRDHTSTGRSASAKHASIRCQPWHFVLFSADAVPSSPAPVRRTPAIDVRALSKLHGQTPALLDVTLAADDRELVVITGPAGAGKTTLLKLLAGHMTPSGGRIRIHGIDARTSRLAAHAQVGYVPQSLMSCGDMRPGDLLTFSGQARQIAPERLEDRLREVIAECELGEALDSSCSQLDAPARARVAIAQVLLHDPSVLLLDDVVPLAGRRDAGPLAQLVHRLRRHRTVLLAGPVSLVDAFPDARLVTLSHGRLTFDSAVPVLGRPHRA